MGKAICGSSSWTLTQEVTSNMKFTDHEGHFKLEQWLGIDKSCFLSQEQTYIGRKCHFFGYYHCFWHAKDGLQWIFPRRLLDHENQVWVLCKRPVKIWIPHLPLSGTDKHFSVCFILVITKLARCLTCSPLAVPHDRRYWKWPEQTKKHCSPWVSKCLWHLQNCEQCSISYLQFSVTAIFHVEWMKMLMWQCMCDVKSKLVRNHPHGCAYNGSRRGHIFWVECSVSHALWKCNNSQNHMAVLGIGDYANSFHFG